MKKAERFPAERPSSQAADLPADEAHDAEIQTCAESARNRLAANSQVTSHGSPAIVQPRTGGRKRRKIWAWRVLILLSSLIVSAYAAEFALRRAYTLPTSIARRYPMGPRQLGAELRLRQLDFEVVVRYNSYGFRDSSFDPTPPADARTVLFLGDSFVEGHGVEEQARFSNLLIDRLRQRYGTAWRGVNAGQIATQPIDYFQNLIWCFSLMHQQQ